MKAGKYYRRYKGIYQHGDKNNAYFISKNGKHTWSETPYLAFFRENLLATFAVILSSISLALSIFVLILRFL